MTIKNPGPYRGIQMSYTRTSQVARKAYIKTVPPSSVVKYVMGNTQKWYNNGFLYIIKIITKEDVQIRDAALESARQQILRELTAVAGTDFYMRLAVAPHHILREHKQAAVAQADRSSQGMALSFGKPAGRAAQVYKNSPIFIFGVNSESVVVRLREIYKITRSKWPMTTKIEVTKVSPVAKG